MDEWTTNSASHYRDVFGDEDNCTEHEELDEKVIVFAEGQETLFTESRVIDIGLTQRRANG
jgi:hypothetical protein